MLDAPSEGQKTPAVPSVSEPEDIPDDEDEEPTEEEKQEILAELAEEEREAEKKTAPEPAGSPLWQNYTALQNKYPGHIFAYRVGDFYEVFGDNAKLLAEPLNLTLTSRDCTGWTLQPISTRTALCITSTKKQMTNATVS